MINSVEDYDNDVLGLSKETISVTADDGTVYEFEKPDFECDLLKVYGEYIIGAVLNIPDTWKEEKWVLAGANRHSSKWSLTPIKKPWYEDKANFPALIVHDNLISGDYDTSLMVTSYELYNHRLKDTKAWRLATKVEHDSLYRQNYKGIDNV